MFCSKCGTKFDDNIVFCPSCGKRTEYAAKDEAEIKKFEAETGFVENTVGSLDHSIFLSCFAALVLGLNPLYWQSRKYINQAKDAFSRGDIESAKQFAAKSKQYTNMAYLSILVILPAIFLLILFMVRPNW